MDNNAGTAARLLADIARELWTEASDAVPKVLAGRESGVASTVRHFVETQNAIHKRQTGQPMIPLDFQLPEPILHPIDHPRVLVLGWNPGYDPREALPTLATPLPDYIDFYRDRFGPHGRTDPGGRPAGRNKDSPRMRAIGHYNRIERLLERAGLGTNALSGTATYVDAIPWKGTQPSFGDPAMVELANKRLCRIAEGLKPPLILAVGTAVAALTGASHPRDPIAHTVRIGNWEGVIVSMYHPGSYGLLTNSYLDQMALMIRAATATS